MGMVAILFNGAELFEQQKAEGGPCEIWWKLVVQFQRRKYLKIHDFIYVYSRGARADNPQEKKFVCKMFYYFDSTLYVQLLVFNTFWENDL